MTTPKVPIAYDQHTFVNIVGDIQKQVATVGRPVSAYLVSNYTESRSLDMATATLADVGNFVATLVSDLQKAGRLG